MCEEHRVSLVVSGGRVSSVGLQLVDHRELSMRAVTPEASRQAEAIILALATHIIGTGARLRPGDAFAFADTVVRIELGGPSHLEVVRCEAPSTATGAFAGHKAEVASSRWWAATC